MFKFVDRPEKVAWAFVVVAIIVAVGGFVAAHSDWLDPLVVRFGLDTLSRDFYANVVVELLSIGVTVLIIDRLHQRQQWKQA